MRLTVTQQTAASTAQERAAAIIRAQRPQHTSASLDLQRRRVSRWVARWCSDKQYRTRVIHKAQAQLDGLAFRQANWNQEERVS